MDKKCNFIISTKSPQIICKKVSTNHLIHAFKPKKSTELLTEFKENI
ncbi:hypothetical protein WFJ11_06675 [Parvimonas micra]